MYGPPTDEHIRACALNNAAGWVERALGEMFSPPLRRVVARELATAAVRGYLSSIEEQENNRRTWWPRSAAKQDAPNDPA